MVVIIRPVKLGGERIQVRFEFDCSDRVEIWRQGDFLEVAGLYVAPVDIDYSKRQAERHHLIQTVYCKGRRIIDWL